MSGAHPEKDPAKGAARGIVGKLVLKDLYLHRAIVIAALVTGAVALAGLGSGTEGGFFAAIVLLATALIGLGAYLGLVPVIYERKLQTKPFLLSLPISGRQYVAAKIFGCMGLFAPVLILLWLGTTAVILASETVPNGLIPLATVCMGEIAVSTSLILAVALVSESEIWTIAVMVAGNVAFNGFIFLVARLPGFAGVSEGPVAIWHGTALSLLAGEAVSAVLVLAVAYVLTSRRRDFL
jgi:ABC-2 type transport system permease protein